MPLTTRAALAQIEAQHYALGLPSIITQVQVIRHRFLPKRMSCAQGRRIALAQKHSITAPHKPLLIGEAFLFWWRKFLCL